MEIDDICVKLGIKSKKVVNRAKEYMRLSKVKCPMGIGASEVCKSIACIYIASRALSIDFDKKAAILNSGGSEKLFQNALSSLHNILGIKNPMSISEIALEFGQLGIIPQCENLLNIYKKKFLAGIPQLQSKYADFSNVEFSAATFFIMATQNSVKIDRSKLINFTNCNSIEFQRVINSIAEHCYNNELPGSKPKPKPVEEPKNIEPIPQEPFNSDSDSDYDSDSDKKKKKKKVVKKKQTVVKRNRNELEDIDVTRVNDGSMSVNEEKLIIQKKKKNVYNEWKENVLVSNKESADKIKSIRETQTRQGTIDSFFNKLPSDNEVDELENDDSNPKSKKVKITSSSNTTTATKKKIK